MSWQSILKGYDLGEFIIQKEGEKKKKEVEVKLAPGIMGTLVITPEMDKIIQGIEDWHQTCSSLSKDNIGIKGEKNTPTLLEHVLSHWSDSVKRPNQEAKDGAKEVVVNIMKIIREEDAFTKQDLKYVKNMVTELKGVEKYSRSNPKNILFTEQITPNKKRTVRGHYRTAWYERKTGETAVDSSWYDDTTGPGKTDDSSTAKPALWQALFAGGENASGDVITEGILSLLIRLAEEIPEQPITDIRVHGRKGREAISKIQSFMTAFRNLLKMQDNYHSPNEPFKRLWLNNTKIRNVLAQTPFQIPKSKLAQKNFKNIFGLEKYVTKNLVDWRVIRITAGLIKSIIVNSTINTNKFPHDSYRGIFLSTPSASRAKTEQKDLWETEYKKAKRQKNLPWWAKKDIDKSFRSLSNSKKSWMNVLKAPILERRPMPVAPGNPASGLHMPMIFNKDKQSEMSNIKGETCDYCENDVVLDCRDCGQKLCNRHLSKPCVVKKSNILKRRKNQEALNQGSEVKEYDSNPRRGTKVSGGAISIRDIRQAIASVEGTDIESEDELTEDDDRYMVIALPTFNDSGESQGLNIGLFTYASAVNVFGKARIKEFLATSEGVVGARFIQQMEYKFLSDKGVKMNEMTEIDLL